MSSKEIDHLSKLLDEVRLVYQAAETAGVHVQIGHYRRLSTGKDMLSALTTAPKPVTERPQGIDWWLENKAPVDLVEYIERVEAALTAEPAGDTVRPEDEPMTRLSPASAGLQRWFPAKLQPDTMVVNPDGDWIRFADHQRIVAENEARADHLLSDALQWKATYSACAEIRDKAEARAASLEKERDALIEYISLRIYALDAAPRSQKKDFAVEELRSVLNRRALTQNGEGK